MSTNKTRQSPQPVGDGWEYASGEKATDEEWPCKLNGGDWGSVEARATARDDWSVNTNLTFIDGWTYRRPIRKPQEGEGNSLASAVYRQGVPTKRDYIETIKALEDGMSQLSPDGNNCAVCGDSGHQSWECHHNPLVLARKWTKAVEIHQCYHCGFVATTDAEAAQHFGKRDGATPACKEPQPADGKENLVNEEDKTKHVPYTIFDQAEAIRLGLSWQEGDEKWNDFGVGWKTFACSGFQPGKFYRRFVQKEVVQPAVETGTPESDRESFDANTGRDEFSPILPVVKTSFARSLERRLAEAFERNQVLKDTISVVTKAGTQAVQELSTTKAELEKAKRSLLAGGYQDLGGTAWKPPLGLVPDFIQIERLQVELAKTKALLSKEKTMYELASNDMGRQCGILRDEIQDLTARLKSAEEVRDDGFATWLRDQVENGKTTDSIRISVADARKMYNAIASQKGQTS